MTAAAVVLAVLLHVLVGLAVWWLTPWQSAESQEQPIMVMFDSSPSNIGLQDPEKAGPPPESTAAGPAPSLDPPGQQEQQQALAPPTPPRSEPLPTLPIFEFSIPPPMPPPPAPTSRDFSGSPGTRPVQRTLPLVPRSAPAAQQRAPSDSPASMPAPLPGPEPADGMIGQGRQRNDYLTRVFRHLQPYRTSALAVRGANQSGRVVSRVTIGRDGGLIDVSIATSSGRPALDAAELEAIRRAAPFPPVPSNMPGDPIILMLPMTYSLNAQLR